MYNKSIRDETSQTWTPQEETQLKVQKNKNKTEPEKMDILEMDNTSLECINGSRKE